MNCKTHQCKDGKRPGAEGGIRAKSRAGRPEHPGKDYGGEPAAEREQIEDQQERQSPSAAL